MTIAGGSSELLSLGPMAVVGSSQRAGAGTALVQHGLQRARRTRYPLVVVLGHPDYYPRFGFEPARRYGIESPYPAPDQAWMALALPAYDADIQGTVRYPPAWGGEVEPDHG